MIFVACGTHHQPFDRLVVAANAAGQHETVVLQRGASRQPAPACEVHDEVSPERFAMWLREARIVVLHGGSSSFLEARKVGRTPIIVPRRPEFGEHVDDHQVRFAASVSDAAIVTEPEALVAVLGRFREPAPPLQAPPSPLAKRFAALVAAWHPDTAPPRR
ncbi:MAG: glycosyltransferase [Myxococcota bacterium]